MTTVASATEPIQRGAMCTKPGVKRTPRLTPMTSCAALTTPCGSADKLKPLAVSSIDTANAPTNQGLVRLVLTISQQPAPVSSSHKTKPGQATTRGPGKLVSIPCKPAHWKPKGMISVTSSTRRLCAEAMRSVCAPWRSPISVISDAAPIGEEK